jgi:hypothetical protein
MADVYRFPNCVDLLVMVAALSGLTLTLSGAPGVAAAGLLCPLLIVVAGWAANAIAWSAVAMVQQSRHLFSRLPPSNASTTIDHAVGNSADREADGSCGWSNLKINNSSAEVGRFNYWLRFGICATDRSVVVAAFTLHAGDGGHD